MRCLSKSELEGIDTWHVATGMDMRQGRALRSRRSVLTIHMHIFHWGSMSSRTTSTWE
jgi:hypothetical protein